MRPLEYSLHLHAEVNWVYCYRFHRQILELHRHLSVCKPVANEFVYIYIFQIDHMYLVITMKEISHLPNPATHICVPSAYCEDTPSKSIRVGAILVRSI